MDNAAAVTEMHRCHDLLELLPGIFFCHSSVSHQVVCTSKQNTIAGFRKGTQCFYRLPVHVQDPVLQMSQVNIKVYSFGGIWDFKAQRGNFISFLQEKLSF